MNFSQYRQNAQEKINSFMYGRYGVDKFAYFLLGTSIAVSFINLFVRNFWTSTGLSLLSLGIIAIAFARMFSRNYEARANENRTYLKMTAGIRGWFGFQAKKFRERKTHKYIKCSKCKKRLRVKRLKGKRTVHCPLCSESFEIKI